MPARDLPASYVTETARIRANRATALARRPHPFQAARWTHPNGHPRCRLCGASERVGGTCLGADRDGLVTTADGAISPTRPKDYPGVAAGASVLDVLAAELAVIEAAAARIAWRRPLFPHEQAAGVDFAAIEAEVDTAAGRMAERMAATRRRIAAELDEELRLRLDPARWPDLPHRGALDYLGDLRNPAVRTTLGAAATAELVDTVRGDLAAAVEAGYARTLAEARAQGIPLRSIPELADLAAVEEELDRAAIRIGRRPVERVVAVAGEYPYARPVFNMTPDEVIAGVGREVRELSDAPDADIARQEAHKATGAGRGQAADRLPTPSAIYASELLDRNTCGPCSLVDGRRYESLAAARLDYPEGRYRDCQGGPRCRGTLVFVWPSESAPTIDDAPNPDDGPPPPTGTPGEPGPDGPAPDAGDWKGRLGRLRAQRPDEWAPTNPTPWDEQAWAADFVRTHGRRPTGDEWNAARNAHDAAVIEQAAAHEALVRQAGAVIRQEADRRLAELGVDRGPLDDAIRELADTEKAWHALRAEMRSKYGIRAPSPGDPERAAYERMAEEANRLAMRSRELRPAVAEAKAELAAIPARVYRDVLAEVQEMGAGDLRHRFADGSVKAKGTVPVEEMLDYLPRRWVEASVRHSREVNPLYVGNIQRGHYRARDVRKTKGGRELISRLNTSGDRPSEMRRVAIHELGHRIEHVIPEVRRLEHAFYRRRTTAADGQREPLKWLGPGYGKDERARPDKFADLYMGKDYGNKPDSYYELLSMGHEALFAGRYGGLVDDDDFRDFLLGLLTMV